MSFVTKTNLGKCFYMPPLSACDFERLEILRSLDSFVKCAWLEHANSLQHGWMKGLHMAGNPVWLLFRAINLRLFTTISLGNIVILHLRQSKYIQVLKKNNIFQKYPIQLQKHQETINTLKYTYLFSHTILFSLFSRCISN